MACSRVNFTLLYFTLLYFTLLYFSNFWTKQSILIKLRTNTTPSKATYFHTSFLILHNYKFDNESHTSEVGAIFELFNVKSWIFLTYLPLYKHATFDKNISVYNVT